MQHTAFSNYNCEIRSYLIEFLFKNKVSLDFLEWRRSFVDIDWANFEINFLNFKASKDLFINFSFSLEKDLIFFIFQIIKDFFIFNFFFYWIFIFLTFLFTIFFLLFLGILKNYKKYFYNFFYMIFYFFFISFLLYERK